MLGVRAFVFPVPCPTYRHILASWRLDFSYRASNVGGRTAYTEAQEEPTLCDDAPPPSSHFPDRDSRKSPRELLVPSLQLSVCQNLGQGFPHAANIGSDDVAIRLFPEIH